MQFTKKQKIAAVLAGGAVAVAGSGVAFAYWTSTGSGDGTASATAGAADLTVSQDTGPTDLAPGVAPSSVTGTITNNAVNKAYVKTLTVTIAGVDAGHTTGCSAKDFGLVASGTTPLAKSTAVQTLDLTLNTELGATGASDDHMAFPAFEVGFADDATSSQDGCKSAVPQLHYSVHN